MADNLEQNSIFNDLLQKLIGTSTDTKTNETLEVENLVKSAVTGTQTQNQTQNTTGNTVQNTTADLDRLKQVFSQQQRGITPDALKAIFTEGAKAVPGLTAATANAVGARSSGNSALATSLTDLNSNLTSQAATQSQALLNASGNTAAQIAELTKQLTTSNNQAVGTTGTTANNQTTDTNQKTNSLKNLDTDQSTTINGKSSAATLGGAGLLSLLNGASNGTGAGGSILNALKSLLGGSTGSLSDIDWASLGIGGAADSFGTTGADLGGLTGNWLENGGAATDMNWGDYNFEFADGGLVKIPELMLSNSSEKKSPASDARGPDLSSLLSMSGAMPAASAIFDTTGNGADLVKSYQQAPSDYWSTLKSNGSSVYEQPDARWQIEDSNGADYYGDLYTKLRERVDWKKAGYEGSEVLRNVGTRDTGGDVVMPDSTYDVPDEWKAFVDKNKLGLATGYNSENFQLSQLTKDGKAVKGASTSYTLANNDAFNVVKLIVNTGLAAGGASAASAAGASGATAGAVGGAISGGTNAAGGSVSDILRGIIAGGVTGAAGGFAKDIGGGLAGAAVKTGGNLAASEIKKGGKANGGRMPIDPKDPKGIMDTIDIKVSGGEHIIPTDVVNHVEKAMPGFFDKLIQMFHVPAAEQRKGV